MHLKLLTLNLAHFKNWPARETQVVAALNQANADIILLQEIRYDPAFSPLTQANYVNSLLARSYEHSLNTISRFYRSSKGEEYHEGLAILSRFPLHNPETLALTKAADDKHTRIIQMVTAMIEDVPIKLVNVHFSNNHYSADQLQETLELLTARKTEAIIAGDFNIFDINNQRDLFSEKYIVSTDTKPYISFPSENATFDYILLPKRYTFSAIETVDAGSDHLGILATIEHSPS